MQKADIKIIAIKDKSRGDAALFYINHVEGLVKILDADFEVWSNFDCWENISVQQWFFLRAMDLFLGKRIDIKCNCCKNMDESQYNFSLIRSQKCYGIKSAYMINKVLEEILISNARRQIDGTYFS